MLHEDVYLLGCMRAVHILALRNVTLRSPRMPLFCTRLTS